MLGDAKLFSDAKSAEIVISDNYCPRPLPTHINASALITTRKYLLIGLDFLLWFYDSVIFFNHEGVSEVNEQTSEGS